MPETCTCPHIRVGMMITTATTWNDECPEHGIGTDYFRSLEVKPYGYRVEEGTSREEYLAWKRSVSEDED